MAKKGNKIDGVLVLNKPKGPTSTECLNRIKKHYKPQKIGHAGTLDPLADGILPVLLGRATKLAPYITSGYKIYKGELLLGMSTDTHDIEGQITAENSCTGVTEKQVVTEIEAWQGLTSQEVPAYSAAKHKGEPLYSLKRRGREVPEKKKEISIFRSKALQTNLPRVEFRVCCSPGTYIRSLAHSLGSRLGCGAVLNALTRECSHPFTLDQAVDLERLLSGDVHEYLLRLRDCLPDWPHYSISEEAARLVANGGALPVSSTPGFSGTEGKNAMLLGPEGKTLAIVQARQTDGQLRWTILRGLWT